MAQPCGSPLSSDCAGTERPGSDVDHEDPAAGPPRFLALGALSVELAGAALPLGGKLRSGRCRGFHLTSRR